MAWLVGQWPGRNNTGRRNKKVWGSGTWMDMCEWAHQAWWFYIAFHSHHRTSAEEEALNTQLGMLAQPVDGSQPLPLHCIYNELINGIAIIKIEIEAMRGLHDIGSLSPRLRLARMHFSWLTSSLPVEKTKSEYLYGIVPRIKWTSYCWLSNYTGPLLLW